MFFCTQNLIANWWHVQAEEDIAVGKTRQWRQEHADVRNNN